MDADKIVKLLTYDCNRAAREIGYSLHERDISTLTALRANLATPLSDSKPNEFIHGYRQALSDIVGAYISVIEPEVMTASIAATIMSNGQSEIIHLLSGRIISLNKIKTKLNKNHHIPLANIQDILNTLVNANLVELIPDADRRIQKYGLTMLGDDVERYLQTTKMIKPATK